MKNYLLLSLIFIFFLSCETTEFDQQEELTIDLAKIESLKSMNENSQRVAFRLLNHKEKYTFRMIFINEFIQKNNLNEPQIELINELKSNFDSSLFLKNDKAEYFKTIFITEWLNRAKNHFTINELWQIGANPYDTKNSIQSYSQSQTNCTCVDGGFWGCKKKTVIHIGTEVFIEFETVPCDSPYSCNSPTDDDGNFEDGCGWFWAEICNGSC